MVLAGTETALADSRQQQRQGREERAQARLPLLPQEVPHALQTSAPRTHAHGRQTLCLLAWLVQAVLLAALRPQGPLALTCSQARQAGGRCCTDAHQRLCNERAARHDAGQAVDTRWPTPALPCVTDSATMATGRLSDCPLFEEPK